MTFVLARRQEMEHVTLQKNVTGKTELTWDHVQQVMESVVFVSKSSQVKIVINGFVLY